RVARIDAEAGTAHGGAATRAINRHAGGVVRGQAAGRVSHRRRPRWTLTGVRQQARSAFRRVHAGLVGTTRRRPARNRAARRAVLVLHASLEAGLGVRDDVRAFTVRRRHGARDPRTGVAHGLIAIHASAEPGAATQGGAVAV